MELPKWLDHFMTKNMKDDLVFYIKHKKELYFTGMVVIAIAWLGILFTGTFILFTSDAIIGMMLMLFGVTGFGTIKMYLHVRKDSLEIKEILLQR